MKLEKSFLICIFLLGVLSLGFVCAEDNSASDNVQDDVLSKIAVEDGQGDVNILATSQEDENYNPTQSNESDPMDKEILGSVISYDTTIYPWTWADSGGDRGLRGISFYWLNDYELTGNTTVYLDGEVIDVFQGDYCLIAPETIWQHYHGKDMHTIKFIYSGDDNYKSTDNIVDFYLETHYCGLDGDVVRVNLPSNVSGVLTVKANGRTIITEYIKATYHRYVDYSEELYLFALEGLDSGVNRIEVIFASGSDMYSFDEFFEYYNSTSKDAVPNQTDDSSEFHREVMAGDDSKVSVGIVDAGNPLLVLALALSSAVLLPRKK